MSKMILIDEATVKLALEALVKALPDMPVHTDWHLEAITAMRETLAEQPAPPPECQTEAEKTAFAFGWFKALESVRKRPAEQKPMTTQTEADRLANQLDYHREYDLGVTHTGIDEQAAAELRRQQAEIERLNEALAEQPAQQEPVAFYVYKPTLPRGNLGSVSDGDLPWVYDQDPSSGFSARMLVTPYPPASKPLTDEQIEALAKQHFAKDERSFKSCARAIEAKLREKNQ